MPKLDRTPANNADNADEPSVEEVTGYLATQVDCPCGYVNYFEGDVRNEILKCEDCEIQLKIVQIF